jgi:uncharacterized protein YggE
MSPTVRTQGTAVVPARPDRAEVQLHLQHVAPTPDAALQQVAERTSKLEELLGELAIERSGWSTSGVSVSEHREWQENRQVPRGYRATSHTLVRLADTDLIGRLLAEAVRRVGAAVLGPQWIIDADNPAHLEAYRMAAKDARRRAEAYAEALGLGLGMLETLEEPGLNQLGAVGVLRAARNASLGDDDGVPVNPGAVNVSAATIATFQLVARD